MLAVTRRAAAAASLITASILLSAVGGAGQDTSSVVVVTITTTLGDITAEIYVDRAPITTENFLRYADDGVYDGASFYRTVRPDNQPNDSVRIEVVQAGPARTVRDRSRPPIPLERTTTTGLRHIDGTLSMARGGPDTATASFFICIGDQPSLDFGGRRNPDGQGFAAFGRVVEGMDVVRRIQMGAVDGQRLVEPVRIESIRRTSPPMPPASRRAQ